MSTKITSKQIKVIDTIDFRGNAIENALINAVNNTITNLNAVIPPQVVTNGDATNLQVVANTIYKFDYASPLTSLTLSSIEISDSESMVCFATGLETITFIDNSNVRWGGGGTTPTLEPNTRYCIAIWNGMAEIDNYGENS